MEIIHDNFGNPWKLNEPTGKFELFYVENRQYKHFKSCETYETAYNVIYQTLISKEVYIFFPNGKTHDDPRFEPIITGEIPRVRNV